MDAILKNSLENNDKSNTKIYQMLNKVYKWMNNKKEGKH